MCRHIVNGEVNGCHLVDGDIAQVTFQHISSFRCQERNVTWFNIKNLTMVDIQEGDITVFQVVILQRIISGSVSVELCKGQHVVGLIESIFCILIRCHIFISESGYNGLLDGGQQRRHGSSVYGIALCRCIHLPGQSFI